MKTRSTDRIKTLRQRVMNRKGKCLFWHGDPRISAVSLETTGKNVSGQICRGCHTRDMLSQIPLDIDDLELLAGRLAQDRPEWQVERPDAEAFIAENYPDFYVPGRNRHCELDLSQLFAQGINALHAEIETRLKQSDEKHAETYLSFQYALEGLSLFAENAAKTAKNARQTASKLRQAELDEIIDSCRHIAHHPPRSFRDALQLL
ncbi:hypothetical protein KAH55_09990 [bacterium]|nr:hypothetical protein [bacterium]